MRIDINVNCAFLAHSALSDFGSRDRERVSEPAANLALKTRLAASM